MTTTLMSMLLSTHDIKDALTSINKDLLQYQSDNPGSKVFIRPIFWGLKCLKVFLYNYDLFCKSLNESFPAAGKHITGVFLGCAPNSILSFNKAGLLIFFIDAYCVWFTLYITLGRRMLGLLYVLLKFLTTAAPFMWLSPMERLPLWLLGLTVLLVELPVALWALYSQGYGIDWLAGEGFYAHWGKHFRYRYATSNRQLTVELSTYAYIVTKFLILFGYFNYDPKVVELRLETPHKRVWGTLVPDYSYLSALLEQDSVVNLRYGILFLLALSSLGVYSIILAGWSSNSKYAFIGALRSAAQMISYEVAISLIILPVVVFAGSLNLTTITHVQNVTTWFLWPLFPTAILFLIAMLAETNRTPFDLPEAEAELVAGYNVDYSSLPFAMFFLGEYCNMILIATLFCLLFLGGGLNILALPTALTLSVKAGALWVFFVIVRATLPRYRYDQLMDIGWKVFLPVAGGFFILAFSFLLFFDALPVTGELPLNISVASV